MRDRQLVVSGASRKFRASLTLPTIPARGGVVPLHPAGDPSKDQLLFRHLSRILPPIGVAVLRFDRRRTLVGKDVPFRDQATDGLDAIEALRLQLPRPDLPVGFWGWSQGAWAASLAAARSDRVGFLVLLACTGVSPAVQMRYGTAEQLRARGFGAKDRSDLLKLRLAFEGALRGTVSRLSAQKSIDRYSDCPWFRFASVPPRLTAQTKWQDMDFDPSRSFRRIAVPTLLFYGETDEWTPVTPSVRAWRQAQRISRNRDVTVVRLPNTTHSPTIAGRMKARAISQEYSRSMVDWLNDRLPPSDIGSPEKV
jgi:uncharacterized protein